MTTIIVPNHLPKINPPNSAIGEPKPKNGKTHNIVKIKKNRDNKNMFFGQNIDKGQNKGEWERGRGGRCLASAPPAVTALTPPYFMK